MSGRIYKYNFTLIIRELSTEAHTLDKRAIHILLECFLVTLLPAATKLWPSYVFTRVCDSVHRGGLQAGRTPPPPPSRENPSPGREEPPGQGEPTPPPRPGRPPSRENPPRTRQTPPPPGKETPEYGLRAAGTHPTGVHSYFVLFFRFGMVSGFTGCL